MPPTPEQIKYQASLTPEQATAQAGIPVATAMQAKKVASPVVSSNTASNFANTTIKDTMTQGLAGVTAQNAINAAKEASKTNVPPPQPQQQKTLEQQIVDNPDAGFQFVYNKSTGERTQMPIGQTTQNGFTNVDVKNAAGVESAQDTNGTVFKKFNDGTYGSFNPSGEYQGPATNQDFQGAKRSTELRSKMDQVIDGTYPLTPGQQSQIDSIKAQFQDLISKQYVANQNFTGGTTVAQNLYGIGGTQLGMGNIQTSINDGLAKIADLNSKMVKAVSDMQAGFQNDNTEQLQSAYKLYDDSAKQRQAQIDKWQKDVKDVAAAEKAQKDKVDGEIRSLMVDARKNGASPEVLAKMNQALEKGDFEGAVNAGGDALLKAEGIVGEYNNYKRDSIARGQVPVSFNEYQNIDANRKAKIAAAGVTPGASGYSNSTLSKVTPIASRFENNQVVKDYNTIAQQVEAVKTAGISPTDDIQRIYAFAKVMDPASAVREGEYKTIQEYSTALLQRAGLKANRVFNNEGFLTKEAQTFLLTTLENRLAATKKSYDNIYKEEARKINKITGGNDGKDFLTDYSGGYSSVGGEIVQTEKQNSAKIETNLGALKTSNPKLYKTVTNMYVSNNPDTGRPYSASEILQAFPELSK